ncbi:unnamed protein product [Nesidiocoris tenuis]|uniref:UBC core domain-containing protein n=1 Tax=Nesidiocoris tenuis TaxID=355587 RepID=A0A6H5GP69_9HEMI|nr:unnamed protein product [Nesidiocoris tenuis]
MERMRVAIIQKDNLLYGSSLRCDSGALNKKTSLSRSPARRLLRHAGYHSGVTPSDEPVGPPQRSSGASIFKKKSQTSKDAGAAAMEVHQKTVRTRRLMKELQDIERSQRKDNPAFTVELINDNLYDWHVRLYGIDQESELANDMRLHDIKVRTLNTRDDMNHKAMGQIFHATYGVKPITPRYSLKVGRRASH